MQFFEKRNARSLEREVEERHQGLRALEGEALRRRVADLQELLEALGEDQVLDAAGLQIADALDAAHAAGADADTCPGTDRPPLTAGRIHRCTSRAIGLADGPSAARSVRAVGASPSACARRAHAGDRS